MSACPRCRGCMPYEGPPSSVCRCGAAWEAPLGELIATLAGLLANPGPPDRETKITEESRANG